MRNDARKEQSAQFRDTVKDPKQATADLIKPISDFGYASNVMNDALVRYEQTVTDQNKERLQQRDTMYSKIAVMNNQIHDKEVAR